MPDIKNISLDDLHVDEDFNSRGRFSKIDVADLAEDIEKSTQGNPDTQGLLSPVLVRFNDPAQKIKDGNKTYSLIAGFRRTFAFKVLNRTTIPAIIKEHVSDAQAQIWNLSENLKRKDLNILQEAIAISKIPGTMEEMSKTLGVSIAWVQIRRALLKLEPEIQKEAASGLLNQSHILQISRIKNPVDRFEAVKMIKDHKIKGEKRAADVVISKTKQYSDSKKVRSRPEIFELQEIIRETLDANLATRVLGWVAGEVTNYEVHLSIQQEAERQGLTYVIPAFDIRDRDAA